MVLSFLLAMRPPPPPVAALAVLPFPQRPMPRTDLRPSSNRFTEPLRPELTRANSPSDTLAEFATAHRNQNFPDSLMVSSEFLSAICHFAPGDMQRSVERLAAI
jgi:hypothetical protein